MLRSGGVAVESGALLAQNGHQSLGVEPGQVPDGLDAVAPEHLGRRAAHKEQVGHWQGPEKLAEVFPGNHRGGVRLFVVAAHLGKDLVEGHPHRHGQSGLRLHRLPDAVGNGFPIPAPQVHGASDVQPALVDGEGFHQVGKPVIDGVDNAGVLPVLVPVGREEHQVGALLPGLPDGLGGFHAHGLGWLVLGQNDAVAGFGVAAHGHRLSALPQLGQGEQLHRGVEAVEVTVEYGPVHDAHPLDAVCSIYQYTILYEKSQTNVLYLSKKAAPSS
ncbi:Uncharacterised protein [uncultured Flavonifractor sp.]|nr:Uncharacterised protein [uncultured Flavonifractor sp.]